MEATPTSLHTICVYKPSRAEIHKEYVSTRCDPNVQERLGLRSPSLVDPEGSGPVECTLDMVGTKHNVQFSQSKQSLLALSYRNFHQHSQ
jgi:hypothetical protein